MVTVLRDPAGGPHRLLLEFTFEFTKEYLGMKEAYVSFSRFFWPSKRSTIGLLSELMLTAAKQYLSDPGDHLRCLTDPQPSRLSPWPAVR
jgi:Protein of unknown function (DUF3435)